MTDSIDKGPVDEPLLHETIGQNLAATAARLPDHPAFVVTHQDIRQTWSQFNATVDAVAKGLMAGGINKGDRVGMWSPNFAQWAYIQWATARIGAIQVNINPSYRTSELEYVLQQSGAKLVVTCTEYLTSKYAEMLDQVEPNCPDLERVILFDTPHWQELLDAGASVTDQELQERAASLSPDDPINIQYTSGTTGFPKGATLSHVNILNNAKFVGGACELTEHDKVGIPVPYYHCFGMVMGNLACSVYGSTMVVPCASFDPTAVLDAVESEGITSLYGVPTMFIAELADANLASRNLSSLRTGIMAGSPCPIEVMRRVIDEMHMDQVTIAYGMTETSPVSTQTSVHDSVEHRVTTVGRVHPHVEVRIVNPETGKIVPRGEAGELHTRGYSVMLGYWNDPEKTEAAITSDAWMLTGDLATMDPGGYVNIVGRIKDLIIRGGENVYPREIEEFLYNHPAIADVQVIGVPDAKYGEEIMAWVQLEPSAEATEEDIKEFCRGKIAHFKVPRYVKFTDGFPMTVTGKVRKIEMRETSIAELGLDAAASVKNA